MLALLPDNDTGDITAADLRQIVTGLYDLASASGGGGVVGVPGGHWHFNPATGSPSARQLTFNDTELATATTMRITPVDQDDVDWGAVLRALRPGNPGGAILVQTRDGSAFAGFKLSSAINDTGSFIEISVEMISGNGYGMLADQDVLVSFTVVLN